MKCEHCHEVVDGGAVVHGSVIVHAHCDPPYRRHLRGLDHECPKCRTTGKVNDPSGRMVATTVALGFNETPDCAYNGCMGCGYCSSRTKRIQVPVQVTCDLCEGEGWLTAPAVPVTKVVDWRRS